VTPLGGNRGGSRRTGCQSLDGRFHGGRRGWEERASGAQNASLVSRGPHRMTFGPIPALARWKGSAGGLSRPARFPWGGRSMRRQRQRRGGGGQQAAEWGQVVARDVGRSPLGVIFGRRRPRSGRPFPPWCSRSGPGRRRLPQAGVRCLVGAAPRGTAASSEPKMRSSARSPSPKAGQCLWSG
jgi:hypothetical protein